MHKWGKENLIPSESHTVSQEWQSDSADCLLCLYSSNSATVERDRNSVTI
jgi:hypothetical protein